jgi:hypothetical protein
MEHRDAQNQVETKAYGNAPRIKGHPYTKLACFLLEYSSHFHGQMPRESAR